MSKKSQKLIEGAARAQELYDEDDLERYAEAQNRAIQEAAACVGLPEAMESISRWWHKTHPELPVSSILFARVLEAWRIRGTDEAATKTLAALVEQFYWLCFHSGVGNKCHAFIEFNGVMSKFTQLVSMAAEQGIDPQHLNQHVGTTAQAEVHDMEYLGDKLRCIFAPFIRDPEAAEALRRSIFDGIRG